MANIDLGHPLRKHKTQAKTHSHKRRLGIRIDMTPMVDVAFLLLTFFILSTTLRHHQVMELTRPRVNDPIRVVPENLLTLRVSGVDEVYWNIGLDRPAKISLNGLKGLLTEKYRLNTRLITLVKLDRKARYRSLVDILDELQITGIGRYTVAPFEAVDREVLHNIPS